MLAALGALAWRQLDAARQAQARSAAADRQRLEALEERVDALRRDVRAHTARRQQGEATQRLLREEGIGLCRRASATGPAGLAGWRPRCSRASPTAAGWTCARPWPGSGPPATPWATIRARWPPAVWTPWPRRCRRCRAIPPRSRHPPRGGSG